MLNFGIMGMTEGNGHPYSFSAIFNGYSEDALDECPYEAIKIYLPSSHRNEVMIPDARVTHIWTQNREMSESVARVSKIPNIVNKPEDLIGKVDAVILARDDIQNHWKMAQLFLEKEIPIYIDKCLSHNIEDLNKIINITGNDYLIMSGSSSRFTSNIEKAKKELGNIKGVRTIHGASKVSWLRYGPHLLDGICYVFGTDVETVQNLGSKGFDIIHIRFKSGLNAVFQVIKDLSIPIEFTCYSNDRPGHYTVQFTDEDLSSYFIGFYRMLEAFTRMVHTGKQSGYCPGDNRKSCLFH